MRAFDGKSKTVQFKIAEDFNDMIMDDSLNFHELLQKCCSMLATVGDGTSKSVALVETGNENDQVDNITCHHCGEPGHKRPDCPKYKQVRRNAAKKKQNDAAKKRGGDSTVICHHCNQPGHIRPNCQDLLEGKPPHHVCLSQLDSADPQSSALQHGSPNAAQVAKASLTNTSSLSADDLQRLVSTIQSGTY